MLDLTESSIPGKFELHFPWRTHNFYDYKVRINAWDVELK
jgi:hypothetical protein